MDFHQQDSDLQTSKPTNHMTSKLVSQGLGVQEQSDYSYSSQQLCSSEQNSDRNIHLNMSSFKKVSKSSADLQNLTLKHAYICAHYNFLGNCPQEHCKKRHIFISKEDGLSDLISDNIDLIDNLTRSGKKLRLQQSTYKTQLIQYRKCKSNNNEISDKYESKFSDQEQIMFRDFPMESLWKMNDLSFLATQIKSQPDLNTESQSKSNNHLIKPKPRVNYKQVAEILENSISPVSISSEIKKNLMSKLKTDIERMQEKIKIITMLKKWMNDKQVDFEEYITLNSSLSQVQQIHYSNFLRLTNMSIPNQVSINQQFQNIQNIFQ
ncbi:unnamed protein product (macronuclear) [Paramecium tetraurelia]|uniref:C3H1-type domain-containing protein n=1 Tax=Paramecium tetraurelia TaxID=5888 RepID=A0DNL8_PARTE|nr:uncharacterized protein GSPATT00018831001 [Paramecium tetraurelia]CAK84635.1 unnamed protein product [Paramecium tetraurelia]|eukprot:XP_001452032.1 hypothetical protein (macronuclear) [Paramecium tetraurelia strain d4-2]